MSFLKSFSETNNNGNLLKVGGPLVKYNNLTV